MLSIDSDPTVCTPGRAPGRPANPVAAHIWLAGQHCRPTNRGSAGWPAGQPAVDGRGLAGRPTDMRGWLARQLPRSAPDREHRLEVVAREDLEGDHRLRPADPGQLHELAGDDVGEHLVARDANDRDE